MRKFHQIVAAISLLAIMGSVAVSTAAEKLSQAGAKFPPGAFAITKNYTPVPADPKQRALVQSKHLVPKAQYATMEECNAHHFWACTCFMNTEGSATCYAGGLK